MEGVNQTQAMLLSVFPSLGGECEVSSWPLTLTLTLTPTLILTLTLTLTRSARGRTRSVRTYGRPGAAGACASYGGAGLTSIAEDHS